MYGRHFFSWWLNRDKQYCIAHACFLQKISSGGRSADTSSVSPIEDLPTMALRWQLEISLRVVGSVCAGSDERLFWNDCSWGRLTVWSLLSLSTSAPSWCDARLLLLVYFSQRCSELLASVSLTNFVRCERTILLSLSCCLVTANTFFITPSAIRKCVLKGSTYWHYSSKIGSKLVWYDKISTWYIW